MHTGLPSSALMPSVQMLKISSEAATKLTGSILKFSVGIRLNARPGLSYSITSQNNKVITRLEVGGIA